LGIVRELQKVGRGTVNFVCASRLEVGRKVVPVHYDAFRLHVSSSYRELFDRAVSQVLEREGWEIVPTQVCKS
jgi:hypothetical protein